MQPRILPVLLLATLLVMIQLSTSVAGAEDCVDVKTQTREQGILLFTKVMQLKDRFPQVLAPPSAN